ncbi:hypothetical protein PCE1_002814 [Barthelona sp. PCE]
MRWDQLLRRYSCSRFQGLKLAVFDPTSEIFNRLDLNNVESSLTHEKYIDTGLGLRCRHFIEVPDANALIGIDGLLFTLLHDDYEAQRINLHRMMHECAFETCVSILYIDDSDGTLSRCEILKLLDATEIVNDGTGKVFFVSPNPRSTGGLDDALIWLSENKFK